MTVMLERWNDDKMDALDAKVGRLEVGLARTDAKLDGLSAQAEERFEQVDTALGEQRREMKAGFERVDEKFERLNRTLFLASVAVIATLIAALVGSP